MFGRSNRLIFGVAAGRPSRRRRTRLSQRFGRRPSAPTLTPPSPAGLSPEGLYSVVAAGLTVRGRDVRRALLLTVALFVAGCAGREARPPDSSFPGGPPRPVVLHFWASWCPSCVREMPDVASSRELVAAGGAELILVAVDDDPSNAARAVRGTGLPLVVDVGGAQKRRFGVRSLPATVVLDRSGRPRALTDPRDGVSRPLLEGALPWRDPAFVAGLAGHGRGERRGVEVK